MPITTGNMSGRMLFAMRVATRGLLSLFLLAPCAAVLCAQTIQFKVVNGITGRPVANVCVRTVAEWQQNHWVDIYIRTDKNGVALLRFTHNDNEVDIPYNLKLHCGPTGAINPIIKYIDTLKPHTGGDHPSCVFPPDLPNARVKEMDPIPTSEVLQHGFASANTCGNFTVSPQPGQVILFVRPRTFHEKVQDWKASEAFPF